MRMLVKWMFVKLGKFCRVLLLSDNLHLAARNILYTNTYKYTKHHRRVVHFSQSFREESGVQVIDKRKTYLHSVCKTFHKKKKGFLRITQ